MSFAVFCDSAPLVRTVRWRTVANTLSIGFEVRRQPHNHIPGDHNMSAVALNMSTVIANAFVKPARRDWSSRPTSHDGKSFNMSKRRNRGLRGGETGVGPGQMPGPRYHHLSLSMSSTCGCRLAQGHPPSRIEELMLWNFTPATGSTPDPSHLSPA